MDLNSHKPPDKAQPLPVRMARLHAKLAVAAAIGTALALALTPLHIRPETRLLIGWDAGIALYLWLTRAMMKRADVAHIRRRASLQDEGAFAILLLSVGATLASLIAVIVELGGAQETHGWQAILSALLTMATILMSWAFMHTIFSLHYAHEYYGERGDGRIGGLTFPGGEEPDYWDFLYFSLVVGMTSQVSDVAITSKYIRRVAAVHGVLSFFFNLTVLALTVNMVSNLIK